MSEAVDGVRKLGHDRRVNFGAGVEDEGIHHRLNAARELFKHHVLVLHFGGEPRGLEQPLAVPHPGVAMLAGTVASSPQPLDERSSACCRGQIPRLCGVNQPVVLRVEDAVDGGQCDVLVAAAIAGDEVGIEHFVVVGAGGLRAGINDIVRVGQQRRTGLAAERVG